MAILAGAGVGYLIGNANEHIIGSTSTTTTSSEQNPNFGYLTTFQACSTNAGYVPCLGSPAHVFNSCPNNLAGPAAPYTCTYTLTLSNPTPPHPTYSFNITLELLGQSGEPSWANCRVSAGIGYADCIPVINSTAFIVAVPAPPPQ